MVRHRSSRAVQAAPVLDFRFDQLRRRADDLVVQPRDDFLTPQQWLVVRAATDDITSQDPGTDILARLVLQVPVVIKAACDPDVQRSIGPPSLGSQRVRRQAWQLYAGQLIDTRASRLVLRRDGS